MTSDETKYDDLEVVKREYGYYTTPINQTINLTFGGEQTFQLRNDSSDVFKTNTDFVQVEIEAASSDFVKETYLLIAVNGGDYIKIDKLYEIPNDPGAKGAYDIKFRLHIPANRSSSSLNYTITLKYPNGLVFGTFKIVQPKASQLSVRPASYNLEGDEQKVMLYVTTNDICTLSTDSSWIKLSKTTIQGTSDIVITIDKNTGNQRNGNITIITDGIGESGSKLQVKVPVSQNQFVESEVEFTLDMNINPNYNPTITLMFEIYKDGDIIFVENSENIQPDFAFRHIFPQGLIKTGLYKVVCNIGIFSQGDYNGLKGNLFVDIDGKATEYEALENFKSYPQYGLYVSSNPEFYFNSIGSAKKTIHIHLDMNK